MSCIPQNEMVVLAGDMNGHVGSNSVGYDGTHGGYVFGARNANGSRILEFADGLNLVICNTMFMKQECKLVTYVAGSAKTTVDCIMVGHGDIVKVRNAKVIPNEECMPKHNLLAMEWTCGLIQQKGEIRSSSQEYVYGNSRRLLKNIKAWLETR